MSKQTLILDSTQIQSYTECPQLWCYEHLLRIVPADSKILETRSEPRIIGSYGHKLLERYYKRLAVGSSLTESMEWALSVKADEICECGHELTDHSVQLLVNQIESNKCTKCKCLEAVSSKVEITPNEKNKVQQRFRDYCFTYSSNEFHPPAASAVEVGFSYPLYEDDEYYFVLEGKIDLFKPTRKGMEFSFVDHKFQLRQRDLYKKSIQFRNYGLVTNAKIAMINYIRLKEKLDNYTLQQVPITYAIDEHQWWKSRLIEYYFEILEILKVNKEGVEIPKNWGACSGQFGYECDYTQLCNERDSRVKNAMQEQLYTIKPEWKPW